MEGSTKGSSNDPKEKMSEKELLKEEKKKVKVLKQALKEGRSKQDSTEAELKNALGKIEMLNNQIQEKVKFQGLSFVQEKRYLDLYQEKIKLEETIIREGHKARTMA